MSSTQLRALSALMEIRLKEPVRAGMLYEQYDTFVVIKFIYSDALSMRAQPYSQRVWLWNTHYEDAFHEDQLGCLLSRSRKALFVVEENQLNCIAKTLFNMIHGEPSCSDVQKIMQEFSQFIL